MDIDPAMENGYYELMQSKNKEVYSLETLILKKLYSY